MNPYTIQYARSARKELETLPGKIQDRIITAIDALEDNPRVDEYRIRVGDYRVVYEIHDKTVTVLIVRIRHRKDAYQ